MADQDSSRIVARLAQAEMELAAKGYSEDLARAAVDRCSGYAQSVASRVSPEIRQQVYEDIFAGEFKRAEAWIESYQRGLEQ